MENELFNALLLIMQPRWRCPSRPQKDTLCMEQGTSEELWERIIAEPRVRSAFN